MLNTILGSKRRMSQAFVEGARVPVTIVTAGPCVVTQVKKQEKDGYWAVQLGFGEKKIKKLTKPMRGHLKAAYKKSKTAARFLGEVRVDEKPDLAVGDTLTVSDIFGEGDLVSVTGTSKGKGFAGVIKRWGFAKGPRTHGQSDRLRSPGSIGGTRVGRVWKGKKMAGRAGGDTVAVKNLKIVSIDAENSQLTLSGPVPGTPGGLLVIRKLESGEKKVASDISEEKQDEKS